MSEMVERVARALASYGYGLKTPPEQFVQEYVPYARAAIEAMRYPTDDVADAGNLNHPLIKNAWREAIDAALSTTPADR